MTDHFVASGDRPAEGENLVTALLAATGQGLYGTDLSGNCTFANPACVSILGFETIGALIGKNMHELIHHTRPDGSPYQVEECRIYQAFRQSEGVHLDDEIVWRADGTSISVEYWSYSIFVSGQVSGCVVAFADITERKLAEDELRRNEELVLALLRATGQGVYGADLEGNCTFANPACVRMLGYESDSDLLGKNMHKLIHHTRPDGEAYPVEVCRIYQSFRRGEGVHLDDEIIWRADTTSFPVEYLSHPMFLQGELAGCVVAFIDITERKQAEDELRRNEELVQALLRATGQGVYGADLDGNCTFANPACVRTLGYETDSDLLGKNMHQLIHHTRAEGDSYPVAECHIYQAFRQGEGVHLDDEIVWRSDGTSFPVEYLSHPMFLQGKLAGCVVAFVDITERKQAEADLKESRAQSERLLLNILPAEIADILKTEQRTIADAYEEASILFADVVGFTPLSDSVSPTELVGLLEEVFSYFDMLADKYDVEKIKTIDDCYMVAAGVPVECTDHAQSLARMALEIQDYVQTHEFAGRKLSFRMGINSGPVVAGVLGKKKFSYDLWGDAVNTASRMESHGLPGVIQVTRRTYELLGDEFHCESAGAITIKGKGDLDVWHLLGERAAV